MGCAPLPYLAGPTAVHHRGRQVTRGPLTCLLFYWLWSENLTSISPSVPGPRWKSGLKTYKWPLIWQKRAVAPLPSSSPAAPLTTVSVRRLSWGGAQAHCLKELAMEGRDISGLQKASILLHLKSPYPVGPRSMDYYLYVKLKIKEIPFPKTIFKTLKWRGSREVLFSRASIATSYTECHGLENKAIHMLGKHRGPRAKVC